VLLPNGACGLDEYEGEADREQPDHGDNVRPNVYVHNRFDTELPKRSRSECRAATISGPMLRDYANRDDPERPSHGSRAREVSRFARHSTYAA
jgi:hypothetical protein